MATIGSLLSFEDLERLPDRPGKAELLRGELIELPPADYCHNENAHNLFLILNAALDQAHARGEASELGRVFHEMGYKLGNDGWVIPDVSVTHAGQRVDKYLIGAPAIAIELISPSTTLEAMVIKIGLYFECGAREVWLIYPKTRRINVYTSPEKFARYHDSVQTPLIPGLSISIAAILD